MPAVFRGNYVIDLDKEAENYAHIKFLSFQPADSCAGSTKSASMTVWKLLSWLSYLPPACRLLHLPTRYSSTIYPFFRFPVSNSAKLHAVLTLFSIVDSVCSLYLSTLFWIFILLPFVAFRPFRVLRQHSPCYCLCFYCGSYCVHQDRVGRQQIFLRILPEDEQAERWISWKITLDISM